ncbi:CoA-acylating methylmalonate-semialdehyde dehydrogenase [Vibrio hippocampi]|uniref:methylmalonate-semialdehyde dehydrogenase (CoA acylating) n=1 Tax=Vibrio hippocampi TaxID=654686 RepID=A0ABM8ZLA9_9VIBR|nr:CoA-acylating methylmalonate-semialdehyde dehydrogenase [Vibrio hippocampi]CAH0529123.1 Putative 3-oxopropanoate dehydrogenase [Vibrio hippocampi]
MSEYIGHLINGEIHNDDANVQTVFNPATGKPCAQVGMASPETVAQAISAAKAAYPSWRNTPPAARAQVMYRYKALLEQNQDTICELISREHGKVLSDAKGELARGIENVEFACGIPELLKGEHSRNVGRNIDAWSEFQPLGVVAGITPFNFPAMVPLWMWPSAIMCGNTFILKPSERDPASVLYIAQLAEEAGLPAGVLNVVNGGVDVVNQLINDDSVEAISFVGSTPVAEAIYQKASEKGKRCQALGGAKNHAVVMPDADLDNVTNALMGAAFGSCGQRCMAISVAVAVGDQVADALVSKLKPRIEALKVGPGSNNDNDMGPLITLDQKQKITHFVDEAVAQGADIITDGRTKVVPGYEDGFFFGGTLFDNVTPDMTIYQQEVFGPVLVVVRVNTLEQAVELINKHEYGNGTCIFTRDGEAGRYFSDQVMVGMVGINVPLPVPVSYHSFGGWKRSLFGDLHAYGPDSVRFYTRRKAITQRWPSGDVKDGTLFSFPSL